MIGGCGTATFDPKQSAQPTAQERPVTKFMDVHSGFVGVTAPQLKEAHESDLAIEAVLRIHERAGHPTSEIYELAVEVA